MPTPDDALHTECPSRDRALRVLSPGLLLRGTPLATVAVLTGVLDVCAVLGLAVAEVTAPAG